MKKIQGHSKWRKYIQYNRTSLDKDLYNDLERDYWKDIKTNRIRFLFHKIEKRGKMNEGEKAERKQCLWSVRGEGS